MAPAVAERGVRAEGRRGQRSRPARSRDSPFITVTGRQDAYVPKLDEVQSEGPRRSAEEESGRRRAAEGRRQSARR
jgi:hypothetical protein